VIAFKRATLISLVCVTTLGLTGVGTTAHAAVAEPADQGARLDNLVTHAEVAAGVTVDSPAVDTKVQWSGDRVNVALHGGKTLSVTLPNTAVEGQWTTTPQGKLRAAQKSEKVVDVVEPAQDGVRLLSIINDKDAPSEFTYAVSLGAGSELKLDSKTGHGAVISADKKLGVDISPAWAVDAKGNDVPTHYELRGGKLVQVVEHTAGDFTYPIVADPKWNSRWFGGELIFNHKETAAIAVGGAGAAATILGSCSFIPVAGQTVCAAIGAALGLNAAYFAAMQAGGKCGKFYITLSPVPLYTPAPGGQRKGDLGCPRKQ
jgi:hypothetical protein